jgi:phosphoglucosamine mutase
MLFGSSGIRRSYDGDLVTLAMQVGKAVGSHAETVILGRDTRTTGQTVAAAFMAGAAFEGARIINGGIAPTPTVAYNARDFEAACMITASHNPEQYNGLKLFNPDGSSFTRERQDEIENEIEKPLVSDWKSQGTLISSDIVGRHADAISDQINIKDGLKIVIDCGNGAGSVITPNLLSKMGVATITLNANTSGVFSRPSEPLPENMPYLPSMIRKTGSSGAVVHDGDADRMMAYDNNGKFLPGDLLLILFAKYLDAKRVVTTYDTSMAIEEVAEVRRTPVGEDRKSVV